MAKKTKTTEPEGTTATPDDLELENPPGPLQDEPEAPREEAETPGHTAHVSLRVQKALRSLRPTALGMAWQRMCAEEDAGPKTKP